MTTLRHLPPTTRVVIAASAAAVLAVILRLALLATHSVSFHADEAVVALMARHIQEGARPVFFYGQAYMGSLDAWLVALGFQLFGESVAAIRLMQTALYAGGVAAGCGLAYRLTGHVSAVIITGGLLAVPPVLVALYTTATLGGYNETLIFGTLIVWLAADIAQGHAQSRWRWLALGLLAGLGWWTNFLIAVYFLPAGVFVLAALARTPRRPVIVGLTLAAAAFLIGSLPFWEFNLREGFASFGFLFNAGDQARFANLGGARVGFGDGLLAYAFIGLPSVIGLRFPWSAGYFLPVIGAAVALITIAGLVRLLRSRALSGSSRIALAAWIGGFTAIFLLSRFSADPTGRYFLPIYLPLVIGIGLLATAIRPRLLGVGMAALVIGYHAAGQIAAASQPPGLTTQFNLVEHLPNDDDDSLIAFLEANDLFHGYSTYWIAFRIAFLSAERIQLDPALPPKPDLTWTPYYQRYPAYGEAVATAEQIAYITANVPALDAALETWLTAAGIRYQRTAVGIYTVYHGFAPVVPRPPFPFIAEGAP